MAGELTWQVRLLSRRAPHTLAHDAEDDQDSS